MLMKSRKTKLLRSVQVPAKQCEVYILAGVEVGRSTGQNGDANHSKSGQRPDKRALVKVVEDVVHESVDGESGDVVGDVDQELVPALGCVGLVMMLDIQLPRGKASGMSLPGSSERSHPGPGRYQANHR